jgi:hypothetical protein
VLQAWAGVQIVQGSTIAAAHLTVLLITPAGIELARVPVQ